jgi:hypothetical protein
VFSEEGGAAAAEAFVVEVDEDGELCPGVVGEHVRAVDMRPKSLPRLVSEISMTIGGLYNNEVYYNCFFKRERESHL